MSLWMPKEIRGIPAAARDLLREALDCDDPLRFMELCNGAHREVYMVGRCPDCHGPIGSYHYCRKRGRVQLEEIVRAD